jgi:uncharacterized membrane protein YjgN (DUF898 family)
MSAVTQPPYGPPNQYGAPGYGFIPPDHPQAIVVLILGIVAVVACPFAAPFAWVMGNRVINEIDASNGQVGGRSMTNAGRIIGIVWTLVMGVALLICAAAVVILLVAAARE